MPHDAQAGAAGSATVHTERPKPSRLDLLWCGIGLLIYRMSGDAFIASGCALILASIPGVLQYLTILQNQRIVSRAISGGISAVIAQANDPAHQQRKDILSAQFDQTWMKQ